MILFQALVISNARRSSLLEGEVLVVPEGDMIIPVNTPQLAYNALNQEDNIWNGAEMGTDSIFMHNMSPKDAAQSRQARAQPSPYVPKGQLSADDAWRQASPFTGTNSVFFGSNGGGNGWASPPQSLYGGGWSTQGHRSKGQDPNHIPSVPALGGTNFAFNAADGYHYGWARKGPGSVKGQTKQAAKAPKAIRATNAATGGWRAAGHEARPQDPKHIPSVPALGGTNFAFNAADGYHYGWARKAPANPVGRRNKDAGVKQVHVAHPKLGWNF